VTTKKRKIEVRTSYKIFKEGRNLKYHPYFNSENETRIKLRSEFAGQNFRKFLDHFWYAKKFQQKIPTLSTCAKSAIGLSVLA